MDGQWSGKSELEKAMLAGIHGSFQIRADEKRRYLGVFRERVLEALTFEQIKHNSGLKVMGNAIKDSRAHELVIHNKARIAAMPLIVQAERADIDFTIVNDPSFIGDIAVVLAAKWAVEVPRLFAEGV